MRSLTTTRKFTKLLFAIILFIGFHSSAFSQYQQYEKYTKAGDSLYKLKDYNGASIAYAAAFKLLDGKGKIKDKYNAACSYAMSGKTDSAFFYLKNLATSAKFSDINQIRSDKDFISLQDDPRWDEVLAIIINNQQELTVNIDVESATALRLVYERDQKFRTLLQNKESSFDSNSKNNEDLKDSIKAVDRENLKIVTGIIERKGWLGPKEAGQQGSLALFLTILHSDVTTQEKYLPIMRSAVKEGKLSSANFALIEDKISVDRTGKQIYGSQVGRDPRTGRVFLYPIVDEENLNERRGKVGLEPIEDYVKRLGLSYGRQ